MKTNILSSTTITGALLLFMFLPLRVGVCQTPTAANPPGSGDYSIVQRGPHSRLWRNSAGQTVTEIATGMNRWDGLTWTPSDPSFEVSPDGTAFVAARIQAPTRLAANLDCAGAVTVRTPENVTLRSTPIAIGLFDAASGKSVIVATLTNTPGVLVDPRRVVYDRALVGGGFAASVVYSLPDTGSFHQDVVFVGFDPGFDPTVWGFAAASTNTLLIQIITELYDPPQPQMQMRPLYVEQNPVVRASMASPDLIDYTLDFGHYVFGPGRAYTTATNDSASAGVAVAKEFVSSSGRTFCVESVPFRWLARELESLPSVRVRTSSLNRPLRATKTRLAALSVPSLREVRKASREKIMPVKTGAVAAVRPRGVTVDYIVTLGSEPTLYSSDTTYYVSGTVYNTSPVTMESAVFKFPTNNVGCIEIESTLTMATTNYRPAEFTAADDNTCGAALSTNIWSGYTGNPSGNYYGSSALYLNTISNIALNNLRFCYQNCAIETPAGSGQAFTLSHAQLVDCITGISINAGSGVGTNGGGGQQEVMMKPMHSSNTNLALTLNNCLMANVQYPFDYQWNNMQLTGHAYNCTIDSCTKLFYTSGSSNTNSGSFTFTNSILSRISSIGTLGSFSLLGGHNGFYSSPTFGSSYTSVSSNPFQPLGAGNYYLSPSSPFLTVGTTNIGAALLSQLQMKTTQPPLILTNCFTINTVLMPQAQRDMAGTALGVHYDPVDYIAACSVSNATLFLVNGVALAYYDNLGIWLQDGSQLVSQGTPNQRNYVVYYGLVQEQPGVVTNALAQALPIAPAPFGSSANPSIFLRLTTICAPTGETNLLNTGDTGQVISGLTLRDCEVYGAGANWQMSESNNTPVVGLTNNVFHRVPFAINNNATITSFNNLFYGTTNTNAFTISIRHRSGTSSPNTNENNVFDGVTASLDGTVGYNAYLHGATNSTFTNTDIRTNLTWLAGPLGSYYQATNSPLINKGSTTADQLGLYDYTVTTNLLNGLEIKETNSIVDLGYHYVAVNSNGTPIDTISNGIPDYLDDSTNNGLPSWWLMEYFGTVDISSNADYDASGLTVLQDYQQGLDPNVITFNLSVTNQYAKTGNVPLQVALTAGIPYYMAALVDDTNWADANWIPYNPSPIVSVGTNQGWHQIWIGLRGLPATGQQTWAWYRVKLLLTPPLLVVTNPPSPNVMQPMIEVQGYCPEPLASLAYDLSNAAGLFTNQQALVLNQFYATNTWEFTTNTFQAFDVPLTNGANVLTFHAADLAGNMTTTNFTYTLSYAGRTNPPVVQLYWPQNGTQISATSFTQRGSVDDFTTTLQATIVDDNGDTNTISAVVERNGNFWIENLPLAAGSNQLTLTATDAASNVTTTNITVMGSSMTLTMAAVDTGQLWQFTYYWVSGTISDPTYSVWVNGVQGTNNGDGTWYATNVPINAGGTAVFQLRAIASSDNGGAGSGGGGTVTYSNSANPFSATAVDVESAPDKPERLYVNNYTLSLNQSDISYAQELIYISGLVYTNTSDSTNICTDSYNWTDEAGGGGNTLKTMGDQTYSCTCTAVLSWPATFWPNLVDGNPTINDPCSQYGFGTGPPYIQWEHCDLNAPTNSTYGPVWEQNPYPDPPDLASGWDKQTFTREAQASMQYDTGGKAVPGTQNFYLFSGSAADMLSTNPIPPETISIGSLGNLDTNGNLWVALPNGDPAVTPKVPGKAYYTFTLNATKYTLTGVPYCLIGGNQYRTTLGIGEHVTCSVTPSVAVNWSLSGGGFISATNGNSTTFIASSSPSSSVITMSIGKLELTLNYNVIAPSGCKITVNTNLGWGSPGTNYIGNQTVYNVDVTPATVSFTSAMFREYFPYTNSWTWPNGTKATFNNSPIPWVVNCANRLIDIQSAGPYPVAYLFNGTNYVSFFYTIRWQEQYLNESGQWVMFGADETGIREFNGTNFQALINYDGASSKPQGPWQ